MKSSRTCPECRDPVNDTKRIYLNLVPDPQIEVLNLDLTKKANEFQFLKADAEIQDAIIKQLERKMNENDKVLKLSAIRNSELESKNDSIQHQNDKLKLELEMHEKQQTYLTTEVSRLRNQLAASQSEITEKTNSTVVLQGYYNEQVKQISHLHSEILNLTERLDQFRGLYVAANNRLQAQLQENEVMKNERSSLLSRNSQLIQNNYSMKLGVDKKYTIRKMLRALKKKYKGLSRSPLSNVQSRWGNIVDFLPKKVKKRKINHNLLENKHKQLQYHSCINENLKIKLVKSKPQKALQYYSQNDDNLKIKLVKTKFNWECVKS